MYDGCTKSTTPNPAHAQGAARSALAPPPPTLEIVEDDVVATGRRHDLPVAASQRTIGPPSIFDEPRLTDRLDITSLDDERGPPLARLHRDAHRHSKTPGSAHPSNGVRTARLSGNRESGSTSSTRSAASGPAAARVCRIASRSLAARAAAGSSSSGR